MKKGFTLQIIGGITLLLSLHLTACEKETDSAGPQTRQELVPFALTVSTITTDDIPVTRFSGGDIDAAALQQQGFGVVAYDTEGGYDGATSEPNFMANQPIMHNGLEWTYAPVKYWPNNGNRLSIFAYAPYNSPDEALQDTTLRPLDPALYYTADTDDDGVNDSDPVLRGDPRLAFWKFRTKVTESHLEEGQTTRTAPLTFHDIHQNEATDLLWAEPRLNQEKMAVGQALQLTFRHALARLAFKARSDKDDVVLRELTLTGLFFRSGVLNLRTGEWATSDKLQETYTFHLNQPVGTLAATLSNVPPLLMLPQTFTAAPDGHFTLTYTVGETWHTTDPIALCTLDAGGPLTLTANRTTYVTLNI